MEKQIIIYGPDARAVTEIETSLIEIRSFISTLQKLKAKGYYNIWKN